MKEGLRKLKGEKRGEIFEEGILVELRDCNVKEQ